jgi:hypothetical protein
MKQNMAGVSKVVNINELTDKDKFIAFLKKHGALRKFKYNLKHHRHSLPDFDDYFRVEGANISGAFLWGNSREGHDYWSKLNNLWFNLKNTSK